MNTNTTENATEKFALKSIASSRQRTTFRSKESMHFMVVYPECIN
jgi:hypothetical protein